MARAQRSCLRASHTCAFSFSSKSVGLRLEFQRFGTHLCPEPRSLSQVWLNSLARGTVSALSASPQRTAVTSCTHHCPKLLSLSLPCKLKFVRLLVVRFLKRQSSTLRRSRNTPVPQTSLTKFALQTKVRSFGDINKC